MKKESSFLAFVCMRVVDMHAAILYLTAGGTRSLAKLGS